MRGKLRDKRQSSKKDTYRDSLERRRPYKRDTRGIFRDNLNNDDDFENLEEEMYDDEEYEEFNLKQKR